MQAQPNAARKWPFLLKPEDIRKAGVPLGLLCPYLLWKRGVDTKHEFKAHEILEQLSQKDILCNASASELRWALEASP